MAAQQPGAVDQGKAIAKSQFRGRAIKEVGNRLGKTAAGQAVKKLGTKVATKAAGLASGLATGGIGTALTAASLAKDLAKPVMQMLAGLMMAAASSVVNASVGVTSAAAAAAMIAIPVITALILMVINMGAYIVPPSGGVSISGSCGEEIVVSDCPLAGGGLISAEWGSYRASRPGGIGHGSNFYWDNVPRSACAYGLPQLKAGQCQGPLAPSDNYCVDRANTCPEYGYSADYIASGCTAIYLPTINGKEVNWKKTGFTGSNGSTGFTHTFVDSSGKHLIVLTHMDNNLETTSGPSGTRIGNLFDQGARTHLHMEYAINGRWERPDSYFCR